MPAAAAAGHAARLPARPGPAAACRPAAGAARLVERRPGPALAPLMRAAAALKYGAQPFAAMGKRSRMRRTAGQGGAAGAETARPPKPTTLRNLAESFATTLARDATNTDHLPLGPDGNRHVSSIYIPFVFEGRRRRVHLPADLFTASRDLQVGCVYGALLRMVRPRITMCMTCGKVQQDLFAYGDDRIARVPGPAGKHDERRP